MAGGNENKPNPNFFVNMENWLKDKLLAFVGAFGSWVILLPELSKHLNSFEMSPARVIQCYMFIYVFCPVLLFTMWLWLTGRMKAIRIENLQKITGYTKRFDVRGMFIVFLLLYLFVGALIVFAPNCPENDYQQNNRRGLQTNKLNEAETLKGYYFELEYKIKNIAERYALKSRISSELYRSILYADSLMLLDTNTRYEKRALLDNFIEKVASDSNNLRFRIEPHLNFLNAAILSDSSTYIEIAKSIGKYSDGNVEQKNQAQLFFDIPSVLGSLQVDKRALAFIPVINDKLHKMLSTDSADFEYSQRVSSASLHIDSLVVNIDALAKSAKFRQAVTAYLDYKNSIVLQYWIENYRAYCQRKIQFELDKV